MLKMTKNTNNTIEQDNNINTVKSITVTSYDCKYYMVKKNIMYLVFKNS